MTRKRKDQTTQPLYPGGPSAHQLRDEVTVLHELPGIIFANGPTGRRARIARTGIEVFEVVRTYCAVDKDRGKLATAYHWLRPEQLDTALTYAAWFPEEMEHYLKLDQELEQQMLGSASGR